MIIISIIMSQSKGCLLNVIKKLINWFGLDLSDST